MGLSVRAIRGRVRAGALHVVHPGVYAVGHSALSARGREWAAVLAAGPGAVLSHRTVGAQLGLRPWTGRVEVTTPRRSRPLRGVIVHQTRSLHREDVVLDEDGLPRTSWARTVIDLAELLPIDQLVRVLERSEIQRHYDGRALAAAMTRANGRRGLPTLVAALNRGEHLNPQTIRSELEELFLRIARRTDLNFRMNHWMLVRGVWLCADVWLPDRRLVIELDSRWHDTKGARARDARRDHALDAAGIGTVRLRKRDLQPDSAACRTWRAIGAAAFPPAPAPTSITATATLGE